MNKKNHILARFNEDYNGYDILISHPDGNEYFYNGSVDTDLAVEVIKTQFEFASEDDIEESEMWDFSRTKYGSKNWQRYGMEVTLMDDEERMYRGM